MSRDSSVAEKVGRALRNRREQLGLSQQFVAETVGRTQTWLSYVEAGKRNPRLDDLDALLQSLLLTLEIRPNSHSRDEP